MSSTKIVLLALVLVAALYIVFVSKGAFSGDRSGQSNRAAATNFIKEKRTPGWAKYLGGLVNSRRPKLVLSKASYTVSSEEDIKAEADHAFRKAAFHLVRGTAHIQYVDLTENAGDLQTQEFDLPCFDNTDDITRS